MNIVLASTSPYRQELLARLGIPFTSIAPEVDEALIPGESAQDRARRLAISKALAIPADTALIIGADQVACLDDRILRKPGTRAKAVEQLLTCSGQTVRFWTAVALRCAETDTLEQRLVLSEVDMRELSPQEAAHYVAMDNPIDCAGSFKWESLGISLFQGMRSDDPTALQGLPLLAVCELLREAGVSLPLASQLRQR